MTCAVHPDQTASSYCRTCGKALCQSCQRDVRGVIYCQDCLAARLEGTVPPAAANGPTAVYAAPGGGVSTSPGLAAVLGFIPGVGAFYNGQFAKGFVHVFIFAILAHLADRADFFGWCVAAWLFYMVFDAYTTAKARMLGQPLPDHIGLNALLGSFGLGTGVHHTTVHPGGPTVPPVQPPPPGNPDASAPVSGAVGVDQAGTSAGAAPAYSNDPAAAFQNNLHAQIIQDVTNPAACDRGMGPMPIGAVILIALGVLLLLDNLGVLSFRWTAEFWPILLIVIGIWLAMRRLAGTGRG
ncbi:MAG TPA: B-box zinc finger protein [Terriglobales bacterium]|nr:B-box zinc finger protein [Terriglobales bacterium]